MKLLTSEGIEKAWHLVKLMETDYGDKMAVSLLKIELILSNERVDEHDYYNGKSATNWRNITDEQSACSNDPNYRP